MEEKQKASRVGRGENEQKPRESGRDHLREQWNGSTDHTSEKVVSNSVLLYFLSIFDQFFFFRSLILTCRRVSIAGNCHKARDKTKPATLAPRRYFKVHPMFSSVCNRKTAPFSVAIRCWLSFTKKTAAQSSPFCIINASHQVPRTLPPGLSSQLLFLVPIVVVPDTPAVHWME